MDPMSGRIISNEQLEDLRALDPTEAAKFTERLESLGQALDLHEDPVEVTYTETELNDLGGLCEFKKRAMTLARSGHPARRAEGKATLKAIELEVQKIHIRAEARARAGITR